jgi:hypothetical protein
LDTFDVLNCILSMLLCMHGNSSYVTQSPVP